MRENQTERLLAYLHKKGAGIPVSSSELAAWLGVSQRQVQKYIAALKTDDTVPIILSSRDGHALNPKALQKTVHEKKNRGVPETPKARKNYILQKLLSTQEGYNIFDLAEELFVSVSTIEADLQQIRRQIKEHHLHLERQWDSLQLLGEEQDKRSMMLDLLHSSGYDYFSPNEAINLLAFHYHMPNLAKKVRELLKINEVYINDYAMNNLLLHLIIMIERIHQHCEIQEIIALNTLENTRAFEASAAIIRYIESQFDIRVGDAELQNFVLLVMNSASAARYSDIHSGNISQYIKEEYMQATSEILKLTEETYLLEPFSKDFIATFALHMKNLILRASNHHQIDNPLTENIKTNYPLIYDIAVFIGQILSERYSIVISEDEIAFIAFHIGSYFENNVFNHNKVTCIFVYADYNGFFQKQLENILDILGKTLVVLDVIPTEDFTDNLPTADLIISMSDIHIDTPCIVLNPFLSNKDFVNLSNMVERILASKKAKQLRHYLTQLFHPDLFYSHLVFDEKKTLVSFLCDDVSRKGYVNSDFKRDVLAREEMSPTVFNGVAVPHAISNNASESFFAFAILETPVQWEDGSAVSLVALIGVNSASRLMFSQVFDSLIDILNNPQDVNKLLKAHNYEDFLDTMLHMLPISPKE